MYLLVQCLIPLFDLGITPGLSRAVAWYRGNKNSDGEIRSLIQLAQRLMWVLAFIFALSMSALSDIIAKQWLNLNVVSTNTVRVSIALMGIALALRMIAGLQKAALMAIEEQVKANLVQSIAAASRTFGALLLALLTGTGILGFFIAQVPISVMEWYGYRYLLHHALPAKPVKIVIAELYTHMRFTFGIAAITAIWLLTTQVDKFSLSHVLPLSEYGAYSLGVHIASMILISFLVRSRALCFLD